MSVATDVRVLDYGTHALKRARYQPLTRQRIDKLRVTPDHSVVEPGNIDVVIDVVYDGADLAEVTRAATLGIDGVVVGHTDARLWDINSANRALRTPGMCVQFRALS